MPVLTIGSTEIDYVLRRSDVATRARITVTPAAVEVVVPATATDAEIAAVLHRRRGWLFDQTRYMSELSSAPPGVVRFVSGAKIPYRDLLMQLRVEPSGGMLVEVSYRNGFVVGCP